MIDGKTNRRSFLARSLKTLAGAAALAGLTQTGPSCLWAQSTIDLEEVTGSFMFPRLTSYSMPSGADWTWHCEFDDAVLEFIKTNSNLRIPNKTSDQRMVSIEDNVALYQRPFVFFTSHQDVQFREEQVRILREYILRGGFIFTDDCTGFAREFYRAIPREMRRIMPEKSMEVIPPEHEIYHLLYEIPDGKSPRLPEARSSNHEPDLGLFLDGRLAVLLTPSDVHCGWGHDMTGSPGSPRFKFTTNVVIYALTH